MKLHSIKLENFQAHSERKFNFSPAITSICGASDVGKSAIVRALRWIALNDFPGDDFIRTGAKKAVVTLQINSADASKKSNVNKCSQITRSKGSGLNSYALDGSEFKSFSQNVPDPIASILNLNEINFQSQHDAPFWFSESAPEVSRRLNAVIDLSVIDTTLSNIVGMVRRAQERKGFRAEELKSTQTELAAAESQRARIADFNRLKTINQRLTDATENHNQLESILGKIRSNRAHALSEKATDGEALLGLARGVIKLSRKQISLESLISEVVTLRTIKAPPDLCPIETAFQKWMDLKEQAADLKRLISGLIFSEDAVKGKIACIKPAEEKFHQRTKGMICPLCKNQLE